MQVKLTYSPHQLDEAVKFISEHNHAFLGKVKYIRESIWDSMVEMVEKFPHLQRISTMGYTLLADHSPESIDDDENEIFIEISVDPALHEEYTSIEQIFDIKRETDEQ